MLSEQPPWDDQRPWAQPGSQPLPPQGYPPPPPPPGGGYGGGWDDVPGWRERAGTDPSIGWGAPQPGAIPLRPLAVGEILDGAIAIMRRHPAATLGLSAVVAAAQAVIGVGISAAAGGFGAAPPTSDNIAAVAARVSGAGVVGALVDQALSALLIGMIVAIVVESALGRDITLGRAWQRVRPRFWRVFGAALLAAWLPFLGLIGLIVFGVFLWAALAFAPAVVVVEDSRVWASLRRSWRLAVPSWWRVFGVYVLAVIIAAIVNGVIAAPAAVVTGLHAANTSNAGFGAAGYALTTVLGMVGRTVTAPFVAGVVGLLYLDRRMRAEAYDQQLARAAATAGGPSQS